MGQRTGTHTHTHRRGWKYTLWDCVLHEQDVNVHAVILRCRVRTHSVFELFHCSSVCFRLESNDFSFYFSQVISVKPLSYTLTAVLTGNDKLFQQTSAHKVHGCNQIHLTPTYLAQIPHRLPLMIVLHAAQRAAGALRMLCGGVHMGGWAFKSL